MRTEDASTVKGSQKEIQREEGCVKEDCAESLEELFLKVSIGATFRLFQLATLAGLGACACRKL